MSRYNNQFGPARDYPANFSGEQTGSAAITSFLNAVYAWMAAGLGVTALVAWWVSTRPDLMQEIFRGPVILILIIAELALVFTVSAAINRISATTATVLFLVYAALNGLTLSALLLIYAHAVLASAFIVTAGTFGVTSLYGYLTQRDLTRLGSLMFMGLIGLVLASVVSFFWHNTMLQVAINYIGVVVFVGLTAYDTQKLKAIAMQTAGDAAMAARLSVSGALMLYLDFLNLFLFILRIMGDRQR
jgi:FtsH-binding integral membrane protein